ncbi:large ribosomal subunit protein bL20m [Neocloeon triangulifer]|uniref:large ribosomal subunit protein bL20m n=1 Tax=Neocloeon triangulifer TaxID=2078957 RepID=UPI00286F85CA|nr:large ribosomal subunit protein bL20m [Neocloeon triangulifer]
MVFLSNMMNFAMRFVGSLNCKGPDKFWRKRKYFKMSAHFTGRKRNCFRIGVRYVHRALVYNTQNRKLHKESIKNLWDTRLNGACMEHGFSSKLLLSSLERQNIMLDRKSLSNLAIWEPRTFKSLMNIAWMTSSQEKMRGIEDLGPAPKNVIVPKIEEVD